METWLAVMGLVACGLVWASMAAGPERRQRWQWRAQQAWQQLRQRLRNPVQARRARREAAAAIARARRTRKVDRVGNVYRPDAFKDGSKDTFKDRRKGSDKLH